MAVHHVYGTGGLQDLLSSHRQPETAHRRGSRPGNVFHPGQGRLQVIGGVGCALCGLRRLVMRGLELQLRDLGTLRRGFRLRPFLLHPALSLGHSNRGPVGLLAGLLQLTLSLRDLT